MKSGNISFVKAFLKITLASVFCLLAYLASGVLQVPTILRALFENFEKRDDIARLVLGLFGMLAFPLVLNSLLHGRDDMEHLADMDYRSEPFAGWKEDGQRMVLREFAVVILLVLLSLAVPVLSYFSDIVVLYMPFAGSVIGLSGFLPQTAAIVLGGIIDLIAIAGGYITVMLLSRRRAVRKLMEQNKIRF